MNWKKRFWQHLNIYIPIIVLLLSLIGLIAISSAVEINKNDVNTYFLQKQIIAVVLGFIAIIVMQFYDYSIIRDYSDIIYLITVGLLILLLVYGTQKGGGKSWIHFGPINFQPSEIAKLTVIFMLARVLDDNKDNIKYLSGILKTGIYAFIPFVLIILQNDLGTALVILFIYLIMLYTAGGNRKFMLIIFGGSLFIIVLIIAFHFWFDSPLPFLKEYQLNRLIVFVKPGVDPYGAGYNILQSKIAVGSGKLFGKGLFAGTQNQLNFLPEKHTDFIFSVLGEEFGFIGVVVVLGLYFLLFWHMLNIAVKARDDFGRLLVTGVVGLFFFHVLQNIGMTMGVMPITGIPLPFISYGGSAMLTNLIAIGLIININVRKKKIMF